MYIIREYTRTHTHTYIIIYIYIHYYLLLLLVLLNCHYDVLACIFAKSMYLRKIVPNMKSDDQRGKLRCLPESSPRIFHPKNIRCLPKENMHFGEPKSQRNPEKSCRNVVSSLQNRFHLPPKTTGMGFFHEALPKAEWSRVATAAVSLCGWRLRGLSCLDGLDAFFFLSPDQP